MRDKKEEKELIQNPIKDKKINDQLEIGKNYFRYLYNVFFPFTPISAMDIRYIRFQSDCMEHPSSFF